MPAPDPVLLDARPEGDADARPDGAPRLDADWWRQAVVYQVYPRSFADSDGDGLGDIPGVTSRVGYLAELGVDAIWLSPFYPSALADGGYDVDDYRDVAPELGTLTDFDALVGAAHAVGIKIIVDIVPNHSSDQHELFRQALAAGPGSPERDMYVFAEGRGEHGELPPNNWTSIFHGPAWTRVTEADGSPGQWYLHIFDTSQPDWNWENPRVHELFQDVLRFWLDRGVDGFRIDVAHGMAKPAGLPDMQPMEDTGLLDDHGPGDHRFDNDEVHQVHRRVRAVLDEHPGRGQPRHPGQVDRRLGVAAPGEHAALPVAERKDMTGPGDLPRLGRRVGQHPHGAGAVGGADPGAHAGRHQPGADGQRGGRRRDRVRLAGDRSAALRGGRVPRLPGGAGHGAAERLHDRRRQPGRRHPLCGHRPEDPL